ncbi:DUF1614 domain-containing protein [Chloroflexota bacterium]
MGSIINIPISRCKVITTDQSRLLAPFSFFFYRLPRVRKQVIAINVGGALLAW